MLDETPASVAAAVLDRLTPGTAPLVAGDGVGPLLAALEAAGSKPIHWTRHAGAAAPPAPWPPEALFSSALVRLPKGREALTMTLHAVAARIAPGAPIALFGANSEGVRSADRDLATVAEAVATVETKRHCRVMAGRRRATIEGLQPRLADWRQAFEIEIAGEKLPWISYPGLFAHGRLDEASALLIASLPAVKPGVSVLDFGSGGGVLGRAIRMRTPDAALDLLDADALALEAARENVPGARLVAGLGLSAVSGRRYAMIVSNPPLHLGVAEDTRILMELIREAPRHLAPGGRLVLVVQRRVRIRPALNAAFGEVTTLADDGRFTVLSAGGPKPMSPARAPSHRRRGLERR